MAEIYQRPRLQLGDAPLSGYAGSQRDQFALVWQTTGALRRDRFEVQYRRAGSRAWQSAPQPTRINTGVDSRVNHTVTISGVDYNAPYTYRVRHFIGNDLLGTYQENFKTRLPAGSNREFTFAAYGDAAEPKDIQGFRQVQDRINQIDPAFGLLLGDNAYKNGSQADYDYRFVERLVPEATEGIAKRIDFSAIGNHDLYADNGRTYRQSYELPIPVAGVDSVAAPRNVPLEHNYSFDYGNTHFVTFDSNSFNRPATLDRLLDYVEADLAASDAQWKIVFAHHPVGGAPDKPQKPGDNYYQQVVPRLRQAGVDLFLTGHSHTFSWSYPLLGFEGNQATFVNDTDKVYDKGAGLIQAVIGTGGTELRPGRFNYPFVASGFSQSTARRSEHGFAQVSVSEEALTVDYVAARDGRVIDSFQIVDGGEDVSPVPMPTDQQFLFAVNRRTVINGVTYKNEDIVAYDGRRFSQWFDGSDVGIERMRINAIATLSDTEILMSFGSPTRLQMGGASVQVDDSDIVKFTAGRLGATTAGSFSMYFDGSDVGLTDSREDINGIAVLDNGDLLISTVGSYAVDELTGRDEDLMRFAPDALGSRTQGRWQTYFDGSDVGLTGSQDDIDAIAFGDRNELYLSTVESTRLSGRDEDLLRFSATRLGDNTAGTLRNQLVFDSSALGINPEIISALDIV